MTINVDRCNLEDSRRVFLRSNGQMTPDLYYLDVVKISGTIPDIYFNVDYLSEWFSVLPEHSKVTMEFANDLAAIVCRLGNCLYLIMPMKGD